MTGRSARLPPVSLESLSNEESAVLFGRAAGVDLTDGEAASQVLRQCGGLPLALRMAGARLRHRPGWTVAVLAERLRANASRYDAVFGMSLQQLDTDQRRMFRLLGVLPGADFDGPVAGALTAMTPVRVSAVLEDLVDAHLVQEPLGVAVLPTAEATSPPCSAPGPRGGAPNAGRRPPRPPRKSSDRTSRSAGPRRVSRGYLRLSAAR